LDNFCRKLGCFQTDQLGILWPGQSEKMFIDVMALEGFVYIVTVFSSSKTMPAVVVAMTVLALAPWPT
jgi:hypothetical protein